MTQYAIREALAGLPDVHVTQVGTLWQVRVGNHAGARENGLSLAHDLRALYEAEHMTADEPEEVEIPEFLEEPAEEDEPGIEAASEIEPEPEIEEPEEDAVPEGLADLVRENEPYGDTQARLWALYLEINGKLMLGLATEEEGRLHSRLHGHLEWISRGAAEVIGE